MTTYDQNPTAGIGDPYWYEWTVGQNYVIDMLNTDNGIESVILQATEAQGLDDVVIVYSNGTSEYVQVKHTRAEDTITFGNMLSLLKSMSRAWSAQKKKWKKCTPVLFSNRIMSTNSTTMKGSDGTEYQRPALGSFLTHLQSELVKANQITDVQIPEEWSVAWGEWYNQLNDLSSEEEKIKFLKLLVIKAEQPGLDNLTNQVTKKIATTFGISKEKATSVLSQLDHALRQ